MDYLIGIDVGTQSLRSCLFDINGNLIDKYIEHYQTNTPHSGWVEQNPEDWLKALMTTVSSLIINNDIPPQKIKALSYACTSCTVVLMDEDGKSIRPAIMWLDERAWKQAEKVTKTNHSVLQYSGGEESPQWMLPKIMWLKENEPHVYKQAKYIVEQTDFFTYHLTGKLSISKSNAAAKWHYASLDGGWPIDLFKQLNLNNIMEKWPDKVIEVGKIIGTVSKNISKKTGLSTKTQIIQGGVDSHAAMVGVGAIEEGYLALVIGSSSCLMAQSKKPIYADIWGPYQEAIEDNTFTLGGGQSTTGSIIQWLKEEITKTELTYQKIDEFIAEIPPGSGGLIALDFFQGNRTPFKDPFARGAILGLTLQHRLPHVFRAFYEAAAYGTRAIIDNLNVNGYVVNKIIAAGGGAKSNIWMQIHADINYIPILIPKTDESTSLGAAIWASIGAGIFTDYRKAITSMVKYKCEIKPNPKNKVVYDFYYHQYLKSYNNLKNIMHKVVKFEKERNNCKDLL